jgi:Ni/Fe-hydrogenase 1 B-type cytochrome subunit
MSAPIQPGEIVQVYVWEWPVRIAHWLIAGSLVMLAATGMYMGHPYIMFGEVVRAQFLMGTVKLVHFLFAILFSCSVVARIGWMFTGNRFSRWDKFIPVAASRRTGIVNALRFYLFQLRKPPGYVGHNPLAGFAYVAVFFLYLVMITSGFALYADLAHVRLIHWTFSLFRPLYGSLQTARFLHHGVMYLLLGFGVHHVYSAVLMSQVEANATMESMFSGFKFVKKGDLVHAGDWQGAAIRRGINV